MSTRTIHAVMVTPSASGGHARYTWELLTALRTAADRSELSLTLLTSVDLDAEFRTSAYEIADVLPALAPRAAARPGCKQGRNMR
jgi:hypothetical protein